VEVGEDVARQVGGGDERIVGVMVESHLNPGRQDLVPGQPLAHGVSITDPCLGWDETAALLQGLADGVKRRRLAHGE
jgi:3-deoxy-7-phosphoheptulonate synthase